MGKKRQKKNKQTEKIKTCGVGKALGLVTIYTFWALVKTGVEMGGFPSIDDFIHP